MIETCPCCGYPRFTELGAQLPKSDEQILLGAALRIVMRGGGDAECACWRVADALLLLGQRFPHAMGIRDYTGRGARLTVRLPKKPRDMRSADG